MRTLSFALLVVASSVPAFSDEYELYYLGGQSNMDGYGRVKDLPAELRSGFSDVLIFHGNTAKDASPVDGHGTWTPLKPGHGVGFKSNGESNLFILINFTHPSQSQ